MNYQICPLVKLICLPALWLADFVNLPGACRVASTSFSRRRYYQSRGLKGPLMLSLNATNFQKTFLQYCRSAALRLDGAAVTLSLSLRGKLLLYVCIAIS